MHCATRCACSRRRRSRRAPRTSIATTPSPATSGRSSASSGARHHRRRGVGRRRSRLPRALRGHGGDQPRARLGRPQSYGAHSNLCVNQINRWGTEAQKAAYLPKLDLRRVPRRAGHERAGRRLRRHEPEAPRRNEGDALRAERHQDVDHQRPRPPTCWWSTPRSTRRRHEGRHRLPDRAGDAGFSCAQKLDKLGMRGSNTCELVFEDCRGARRERVLGEVGRGAATC